MERTGQWSAQAANAKAEMESQLNNLASTQSLYQGAQRYKGLLLPLHYAVSVLYFCAAGFLLLQARPLADAAMAWMYSTGSDMLRRMWTSHTMMATLLALAAYLLLHALRRALLLRSNAAFAGGVRATARRMEQVRQTIARIDPIASEMERMVNAGEQVQLYPIRDTQSSDGMLHGLPEADVREGRTQVDPLFKWLFLLITLLMTISVALAAPGILLRLQRLPYFRKSFNILLLLNWSGYGIPAVVMVLYVTSVRKWLRQHRVLGFLRLAGYTLALAAVAAAAGYAVLLISIYSRQRMPF